MNFGKLKIKFRKADKNFYRMFAKVVGLTEDNTTKNLYIIFRFSVIASLVVFFLNIILRIHFIFGDNLKLGEFGDFFGGVLNPILTFLMFFGLVITIILQKTELSLARKEFKRTADALNCQSLTSQQQVIETTFFNLLKIHSEIVESLKINQELLSCWIIEKNASGRAVFSAVASLLYEKDNEDKTFENYCSFQDSENHLLGHYFRNIYQILKFISESNLPINQQLRYSRLIRAQLSADELALLFFNCLCPSVDSGEFKALVIKYKLLEHLKLSKHDLMKDFCIAGRSIYTSKEKLLKYVKFENGKVVESAYGSNPVATSELYTEQDSEKIPEPPAAH